MFNREELLEHLKYESRVFENPALEKAFTEVDRQDFVGPDYEVEAYEDYALPIGNGQSISQPTLVAFMLELLELKAGEEVLDVGSGSGWTTALMANMVGPEGSVLGVEIIPELIKFGQKNLKKYNFSNAEIKSAKEESVKWDGTQYDKILVSASAEEVPPILLDKLKAGGIMVIPIDESLFKITKDEAENLEEKEIPDLGVSFVPYVKINE